MPLDGQRPGRRIQARGEQAGVDPVEAAVGHDQRRDAVDRQLRARRQRRGGGLGRWDGRHVGGRGCPLVEERAADQPAGDGRGPHAHRRTQEAAALEVHHLRPLPAARRGQAQQPTQRPGADGDGHRRGHHRQHRVEQRIQHGGQQREQAQRPESNTAGDQRAPRQQPDARGQDERANHHRHAEHRLVGRAEQVDHELLGVGRLERDQQRADRQHRRRRARHQAGDELRHAQPECAGQHAAQGGHRPGWPAIGRRDVVCCRLVVGQGIRLSSPDDTERATWRTLRPWLST